MAAAGGGVMAWRRLGGSQLAAKNAL